MINLVKKIVCVLLACIFSFSLIGCSSNDKDGDVPQIEIADFERFTEGRHQFTYTETSNKIVENGKSDYVVVISKNADNYIKEAAEDMQELFQEATGVELPLRTDESVTYSDSGKYFVLGKNELFKSAGLSTDNLNLGTDGYIIKTVGQSVFIAGDGIHATNFGVCGYMEIEFNYDIFSQTTFHIDKKQDVTLKNFDVIDIPDCDTRSTGMFYARAELKTMRRMRFSQRNNNELFLGHSGAHNTIDYYLPLGRYNNKENHPESYHPDWFAKSERQICYTAHGNPTELEAMKQEVLSVIIKDLKSNPLGYIISFSQQDFDYWCECSACTAEYEKYNKSWAASVIKFINDLSDRVNAWMETEEGKPYARKVYFSFLAYLKTLQPPIYEEYDKETNSYKYTPIDDSVICRENLRPLFAPIEMDYQQPFTAKINANISRAFYGWRAITNGINVYNYDSNDVDVVTPYDTFSSMESFYHFAACSNTYWFYTDGGFSDQGGRTAWQMLKTYLASKMAWNVAYGMENYIDNYFKYNYDVAGNTMRKWFNEWRVHAQWMTETYTGKIKSNTAKSLYKEYWSRDLLLRWLDYANQAIEEVSYLKYIDINAYQTYYDNITMERVSLYYMLVELYKEELPASMVKEMKLTCKEDVERIGIVAISGSTGGRWTEVWVAWGV